MEFLLSQLVYFSFLQSVFLLVVYTFSARIRKTVSSYLIVLIVVMSIGLLGRIWVYTFDGVQRLYSLSEYAIFLFGPTVFLFVKSSLSGSTFRVKNLVHYVPGFLYIIIISFYYVFAPGKVVIERLESGELFRAVVLFMGTGLLVNTIYWVISFKLFFSFTRRLTDEASFTVKHKFLQSFLTAIGLCLLCWIIVYFVGIIGESWLERSIRPFIWIAICLLMLFLSYYSISEPDLFKVTSEISKVKYAHSKLTNEELDRLKVQLDTLMTEKKPFLNRNLMKADLAEMLGVNNPEVARLLNENIGMNFFEYVNYFRIKEFIEIAKMDHAKNLTFFGIAQEAGFNSKTTFNKSFKKIMGSSPREYFSKEVN